MQFKFGKVGVLKWIANGLLTSEEKEEVVAICDHLKNPKLSHVLPHAFTEHGAVMPALLEKKYDGQFKIVFDALRGLIKPPARPRRCRLQDLWVMPGGRTS